MKSFLKALILVTLTVATANGFELEPLEQLSTPWLQELYIKAIESKVSAVPSGICLGAQGAFKVVNASSEASDEQQLLTTMESSKKLIGTYLNKIDLKEARLGIVVAGLKDAKNSEDLNKYVTRAVNDEKLVNIITEHKEEFSKSTNQFVHTDSVYVMKKGSDKYSSMIRFFGVYDQVNNEIFLVGNGDCQF